MKVAYLGPEKTFTEKVTRCLFPVEELFPMQPIRKVVLSVEEGKMDLGVVPLENFYNGPVIHTLDSLVKCTSAIVVQEKALKIVHYLGALKGHLPIVNIYSKDQAIEQCDGFIADSFPDATTISTASTAEAADYIAREKLMNSAAIASKEALKKSGLEIIAEDLCPNNSTRFVVLGKDYAQPTGDDKTIIAIHPLARDEPGVLADCLNIFKALHVNLEGLHSRPDGKKGYYFYAELNGHEKDENIKTSLQAIKFSLDPENKYGGVVRILGSYANSHWKDEN